MDSGILSISLLAAWSLIYFIIKSIFDTDIKETDEQGKVKVPEKIIFKKNTFQIIIFAVYLIVLLIFQIFSSIYGFQSLAGTSDISSKIPVIMLYTIVPWFVMFGSLIFLLKMYPGWKISFSNTFGYFIVKLLGIGKLMNKLLINFDEEGNSTEGNTDDENFNRAIRTVRPIVNDSSLIINEITSNNFNNFWFTMENGKLLKSEQLYFQEYNGETREGAKENLERFINIKENIAELFWYILAGCYIASYVQTLLNNIDVPVSQEQLNDTYNDNVENSNNSDENNKVYVDEE